MKKKISIRAIVLGLIGIGLFAGLTYLIANVATTDWRKYDIDEVENLFSFYYGEEEFNKVDDGKNNLSDVGILLADNDDDRSVLVMKNYDLGDPKMDEEKIENGYKYRYLLLETGLNSGEVETDYADIKSNIENLREYYAENEEGNELIKKFYDEARFGKGIDYVYVIFGDEAELMEREMQMLLK